MPVVAAVAGLVSAGLAIGGAVNNKRAADSNASLAKEVGEKNAKILEKQADQGRKVMGYQLGEFDKQAGQFSGSQTSAVSSAGVTMSGSSSLVKATSTNNLVTDRTNLYDNYQAKIDELGNKADLARKTGTMQEEAITAQGWASLWSGLGQGANAIAGSVNQFGKASSTNPFQYA